MPAVTAVVRAIVLALVGTRAATVVATLVTATRTARRTVLRTAAFPLRLAALRARTALAGGLLALVALVGPMAGATVSTIGPLATLGRSLAALVTTTAGIAAMAGLRALVMAPALAPNLDRLGFGGGLSGRSQCQGSR